MLGCLSPQEHIAVAAPADALPDDVLVEVRALGIHSACAAPLCLLLFTTSNVVTCCIEHFICFGETRASTKCVVNVLNYNYLSFLLYLPI